MNTTINIIVFGLENIGSSLVSQLISQQKIWETQLDITLKIPVITSDQIVFLENNQKPNNWDANFADFGSPFDFAKLATFLLQKSLTNTIIIDTTNSTEILYYYPDFLQQNVCIISTNKIAKVPPPEISFLLKIAQKEIIFVEPNLNATQEITTQILKIAQQSKILLAG
ncbi:hypothetical protein GV828_01340 [Flavobacterium sp. NST-5]|uniref:Aspartate/homoserine dehydrogenase NAD-binding domain-containing protein n=1 Tax=Flavobacterium ichthyis TaxID=2698827 RepID=A0ABW9Z905_9FLAO|nr:hypothetical protein [Flavobacterium ichthyis]NBL63837.1 hypothetical protein [Flavobacterium ichthyis]